MQLLLAILLYLQLIVSPGTYQKTYIDDLETQHHSQIQAVQSDPSQMEIVNNEYMPLTPGIVVQDGEMD